MIKLSVKVVDNVNNKLNRISKDIMKDATDSVEDATRFATMKWKELMPKGTGKSAGRIYSVINKGDNTVTGLVVSPAYMKPKGFYLNLFLDKGNTPGQTETIVKGGPYKLRRGFFGASDLTAMKTEEYFNVLAKSKINTTLEVFK